MYGNVPITRISDSETFIGWLYEMDGGSAEEGSRSSGY
jgi:hypothetical protein